MSSINLGCRISEVGTVGAAAASPVTVPGIKSTDTLLWVVRHHHASAAASGTDPSAWVVSAGAIQSASVDTSGYKVAVAWIVA